jgi:dihydroneopterin aldolase
MPMNESLPLAAHRLASASHALRHVFIRDLIVARSIGVHRHERDLAQRIRINVDMAVTEGDAPHEDQLEQVLCYEDVTTAVRQLAEGPHVNLVETLAEQIADCCLRYDQVQNVRVRVEKLDVFVDVASVGIEIERFRAV